MRSPLPDPAAVALAERAASISDWAELRTAALACVACPELAASRRSVVFGHRPPGSDIVLVGEAPGAEEDATGEPFVGRSGQLLERLLQAAGLSRSDVAIANVLKCRPPANRKPKPVEVARCRGWLDRQLTLIDPVVVVTLGGTAAEAFLGRGTRIAAVRGHDHLVDGRVVVPTYHPSAALRFGPNGEPMKLLGEDLGYAARRAVELRAVRAS